ncbi:hypothetical protein [Pelagibacterium montanilacus]|uniref:hypothetical protein n=1 Tax=Pelagibacterium montanilacus TaxID=2185280 RepID=UPI000F8CCFBB|nr:hypothetical protein [Pelagibacterium montanilacus]
MEKILNTYEATAADGSSVTVYEVQESENAGVMESPDRKEGGIKRMQLSDGRPLKMVGERQFKVDGTDEAFLLDRPYRP